MREKRKNGLERRRMKIMNNPTKQEVIEALICLRDKVISENTEMDMPLKERWYIPDCLGEA